MPRTRSPDRDIAFQMWRDSGGKIANREIAHQLGIPEKTVGGWKAKDRWVGQLNGVLQKDERNTPKRSGAPKGNQNALRNIGGGPSGNKKAVTTGEYETISWDALDDAEKSLFNAVDTDELASIDRTIRMMEIRERRMLLRIKELHEGPELVVSMDIESQQSSVQYGESRSSTTNRESSVERIQSIEEALTRLQEKKGKYIELRSKLVPHHLRDELEQLRIQKLKAEIAKISNVSDGEEQEDDGFMDALHAEAGEVWDDDGDSDSTPSEES